MKEFAKRVTRLENWLGLRDEPKSLEEMFEALQRGDSGQVNLMSLVVSILNAGGEVGHLRGGKIPDMLLDAVVEHLGNSVDGEDGRKVDGL